MKNYGLVKLLLNFLKKFIYIYMPTYKQTFNMIFNQPKDKSNTTEEMSKLSNIPVKILNEVKSRGEGAYSSNLSSVRLKGSYKKDDDMRKGVFQKIKHGKLEYSKTIRIHSKIYDRYGTIKKKTR
jgi:hypothetical protein